MALQTRQIQAAKTNAASKLGQRLAERAFRNRRPLGLIATGIAAAAGFLATGSARPDLALLFNTYFSMSNARYSLGAHVVLEKEGFRKSSLTMLSTAIMDMANMVISFIPFLSCIYKSGDGVENGLGYFGVLAVTTVAAQAMERRARFNLFKERFNSAFHHMEIKDCAEYARMLEKRERSWWRRPYWIVNPEGLVNVRTEKEKVLAYMGDRMQPAA